MAAQIVVIGLGQLGMSLARELVNRGAEVLAVDSDKAAVDAAADFADGALCLDVTDESALAQISPRDRDTIICTISHKEPSILCTALLQRMGAKNIVARAQDNIHAQILKLVGAGTVINPDQEYGKRLASRVLFQDQLISNSLSEDFQLTEIKVPAGMVGKSLAELSIQTRYGLIVAAFRPPDSGILVRPIPDQPLVEGQSLLLLGNEKSIPKMLKDF